MIISVYLKILDTAKEKNYNLKTYFVVKMIIISRVYNFCFCCLNRYCTNLVMIMMIHMLNTYINTHVNNFERQQEKGRIREKITRK